MATLTQELSVVKRLGGKKHVQTVLRDAIDKARDAAGMDSNELDKMCGFGIFYKRRDNLPRPPNVTNSHLPSHVPSWNSVMTDESCLTGRMVSIASVALSVRLDEVFKEKAAILVELARGFEPSLQSSGCGARYGSGTASILKVSPKDELPVLVLVRVLRELDK